MIDIQIDEVFQANVESEPLKLAAKTTLQRHPKYSQTDLTIVVGGSDRIQTLNREFMKVDAPTDVLSFPADFNDPESGRLYLGDIMIAFPQAQSQAEATGHLVMEELQLLVVHGVLHLIGYDHATEEQKTAMWQMQAEVLDSLGVKARPND